MQQLVAVLLVSLVVGASCKSSGSGLDSSTRATTTCISNVNELIFQFGGVALVPRDTCGRIRTRDLERATQCFQEAVASGRPADLTVIRTIDSVHELRYVWLPDAGLYRMGKFQSFMSNPRLEIVLDRCEGSDLECSAPQRLYTCEEPRPLVP